MHACMVIKKISPADDNTLLNFAESVLSSIRT